MGVVDSMKACHATAFALMGWLLIVPPLVGEDGHPDKGLPLTKWEQMGNYNSVEECQADRAAFIKRDETEYKLSLKSHSTQPTSLPDSARQSALKSSSAVCVSADDPRLKGNAAVKKSGPTPSATAQ
jgi:hypothetical protein